MALVWGIVSMIAVAWYLHQTQPNLMFQAGTGCPKPFGMSTGNGETILPAWLAIVGTGLLAYYISAGMT